MANVHLTKKPLSTITSESDETETGLKRTLGAWNLTSLGIGAIIGAAVLYAIVTGSASFTLGGFAANGYAEHSPGKYNLGACFLAEALLTAMFLFVRILPMISIFEMRTLLPEAEVKHQ